jgi:hypothetical protein
VLTYRVERGYILSRPDGSVVILFGDFVHFFFILVVV